MKLFSCLFGGGLTSSQGRRPAKEATTVALALQPAGGQSAETCQQDTGNHASNQQKEGAARRDRASSDSGFGNEPLPYLGAASDLLNGLSFSTRVLGAGAYGIVLRGKLDGNDVAVKVMVTNRAADRAVLREVTVGPLPELTHPHVCKTYDTRCLTLTDGLFDLLEEHRAARLRLAEALRSQASPFPPPLPPPQQAHQERVQAAGGAAGPHRRRVLTFSPAPPGVWQDAAFASPPPPPGPPLPLLPLESGSPLAALHEALSRQGAKVGQVVTLVVMEYCGRGNLSRAIHLGIFAPCERWGMRLARRALVRSAAEVARAMLHLHRAGVVHGDLKPANICLSASRDDRRGFSAKVCDFGLCHLLPAGAASLDTDSYGTPAYMAPEALIGHVGKASDVWSFGVILWEALTRERPYGEDVDQGGLVMGIIHGRLELSWPELPALHDGHLGPADGAGGAGGLGGAAAFLARHEGYLLAAAGGVGGCGGFASSGAAGGAPSQHRGTSFLLDSCDTGTTAATALGLLTTMQTHTQLDPLATGTDLGGGSTAASTPSAAGGGGAGTPGSHGRVREPEDPDPALPLLVALGRRCTAPNPADRPCFAEVLGELIDIEIILKATSGRGRRDPDTLDAAARARLRTTAAVLAPQAAPPAAPEAPPLAPPPEAAEAAAEPPPLPRHFTVCEGPPASRLAAEFRALVAEKVLQVTLASARARAFEAAGVPPPPRGGPPYLPALPSEAEGEEAAEAGAAALPLVVGPPAAGGAAAAAAPAAPALQAQAPGRLAAADLRPATPDVSKENNIVVQRSDV